MSEQEKVEVSKPKNKKTCWIVGGICSCLIIIVVILLIIFGSLGRSIIGSIVGEGEGVNSTKGDGEDVPMSKEELINYFVDETTVYGAGNVPINLEKWQRPVITLSLEDTPPVGGEGVVDNIIAFFNKNSTKTKIEKVLSNGDIKIFFQKDTKGAAGSSGPSTNGTAIIDHATVKLSEEATLFENSMESVLAHEIFHALGFVGHYPGEVCRLMSKDVCGSHLTVNEASLIQMMYSTDIPPGSNEAEIRAYFQNWQPK